MYLNDKERVALLKVLKYADGQMMVNEDVMTDEELNTLTDIEQYRQDWVTIYELTDTLEHERTGFIESPVPWYDLLEGAIGKLFKKLGKRGVEVTVQSFVTSYYHDVEEV